MPVCVAGMHRSGTSMVMHLLYQCGLFLGPDERDYTVAASDNPEGFWEHSHFLQLNHEILELFRGGWDLPPALPSDWENDPRLIPYRVRAAELITTFAGREPWGWKDPRSSLTLAFWRQLLPDLRVLVCVRNPLEVIRSLQKRGYASFAFGENLWLEYNRRVLAGLPRERRVLTHTDAYFVDPQAELRRVLEQLGLAVDPAAIVRACGTISTSMRHHRTTTQEMLEAGISAETLKCYMDLCAEAGPVYQKVFCPAPENDFRMQARQMSYRDAMLVGGLYAQLSAIRNAAAAREAEQQAVIVQLEARLAVRRYRLADRLAEWYRPLWQGWRRLANWLRSVIRLGDPAAK